MQPDSRLSPFGQIVVGASVAISLVLWGLAAIGGRPQPTRSPTVEPSEITEVGEGYEELLATSQAFQAREMAAFPTARTGAYEAAVRQREEIAAQGPRGISGTEGTWRPFGKGPLDVTEVTFGGQRDIAGRVDDLFYDAKHDRILAAVGFGGVWQSLDHGRTWRSIGDSLPTQLIGSVTYTPAGGGALLALSGEGDFFSARLDAALGVLRSTDGGKTWKRAKGVPSGTWGFNLEVDPTNPNIVYAATGLGLFRSSDGGRSFVNTTLPTGECAGSTEPGPCYLQNVVTDVVVQRRDRFGNRGGAVAAAVGWMWGNRPGPTGEPQSSHNGIYRSESGRPGTFVKVPDANGFAPTSRVGRVELGAAEGPEQDGRYLYALVGDAELVQGGLPIDVPGSPKPYPLPSNVNGVYVSADFGLTWTKMAGTVDIVAPTSGSSLSPAWVVSSQVDPSLPAPGYHGWYDQTIRPDPTRQTADGVPTRLIFGLEEVWRNANTSEAQDGRSRFQVIGRAMGGHICNYMRVPVCPFNKDRYTGPTTHIDQQASLFVPERDGGVTLLMGNDGGIYRQRVGPGEELDNTKWGRGSQTGFHTLLAYHAAMARDGVAYAGLQDNGTIRVDANGHQTGLVEGDGFGVAVDPDDSDLAYQIGKYGPMDVTVDGGHSWKSINPALTNALLWTPYAVDALDPNHLIVAGAEVKESIYGPETNSANQADLAEDPLIPGFPEDGYDPTSRKNWATVFEMGSTEGVQLLGSATALRGDAAYVGGCANCNPVSRGTPFANVLATNVEGSKPGKPMTSRGWHVASAKGLPRRFITSITIDRRDPRTVFVTLGGYNFYLRTGRLGEDTTGMAGGSVYKSVDAGEHFRDISGDLPDATANWLVIRRGRLIIATDVGVFIAKGTTGGRYALLGRGLPLAPVMSVRVKPGDPNLLLAATYGRGLYTYRFPT